MKGIASFLLLLALVPSALAVDTWEPYPMGPGAIEFYFTQCGVGLSGPDGQSKSLVIGPAWGIHESAHIYLFTGIAYPEMGPGGVDFLSMGIFKNLYGGFEKPFKLDAYFEMGAFGPGLGFSSMAAGLEANLDFEGLGLYARPIINWFHDGLGEGDSAMSLSSGIWYGIGGIAEVFAEVSFAEESNEFEHASSALGFNVLITKEVELILELRSPEPAEGADRSFDITLGAVTVW